jgi:hypothetical protein
MARSSVSTIHSWNGRSCVLACAIARLTGLPVQGQFEVLRAGVPGHLMHAFCRLPDGRIIDANGIREDYTVAFTPRSSATRNITVAGYLVCDTDEFDPLLTTTSPHDILAVMRETGALSWVRTHLGPALADAGIPLMPGRFRWPNDVVRRRRFAMAAILDASRVRRLAA